MTYTKESRCDICIEETCLELGLARYNCDCSLCLKKSTCPKILRPTIRLTSCCTQTCSHCCFECSPKQNKHMSKDVAQAIANFCKANNIWQGNIMGGEIFCHPNWKEIASIITEPLSKIRIVTNGDWANDPIAAKEFPFWLTTQAGLGKNVLCAISNDRWHQNKYIETANLLIKNEILNIEKNKYGSLKVDIANESQTQDESVVPIGRSEGEYLGLYSMFAAWCHNPEHAYSFLIDEDGEIYRCGFGAWRYASIFEYIEGNFSVRFKEIGQRFYKTFIPNCAKCIRSWQQYKDQ